MEKMRQRTTSLAGSHVLFHTADDLLECQSLLLLAALDKGDIDKNPYRQIDKLQYASCHGAGSLISAEHDWHRPLHGLGHDRYKPRLRRQRARQSQHDRRQYERYQHRKVKNNRKAEHGNLADVKQGRRKCHISDLAVMALSGSDAQGDDKAQGTSAAAQKYEGVQEGLGEYLCRYAARQHEGLVDGDILFKQLLRYRLQRVRTMYAEEPEHVRHDHIEQDAEQIAAYLVEDLQEDVGAKVCYIAAAPCRAEHIACNPESYNDNDYRHQALDGDIEQIFRTCRMKLSEPAAELQHPLEEYAGEQGDAHGGKYPFGFEYILVMPLDASAESQVRADGDDRKEEKRIGLCQQPVGKADGNGQYEGKGAQADRI